MNLEAMIEHENKHYLIKSSSAWGDYSTHLQIYERILDTYSGGEIRTVEELLKERKPYLEGEVTKDV